MDHFSTIITRSSLLNACICHAKLVAPTDTTVLLKGATGTGKEIFAQAIQQASKRAQAVFLKLNCAALPAHLIESELFGHKKGSFTGATHDTCGLLKSADGGTLFLDEINALPLSIQGKLLHFLDSGEFLAIGDVQPSKVDVRILSATNTDLEPLIACRQFRPDLYFRLNVFSIELPCLLDRSEDITLLIEHFFQVFENEQGVKAPVLSQRSLAVLKHYHWPGNIRELRNICERFSVLFAGKVIEPAQLPSELTDNTHQLTPKYFALPETGLKLEELEARLIKQALHRTNGNVSQSAKLLGISRNTLIYRIQKHGFNFTF